MISAIHDSPIGPLTLASNGKALIQCEFDDGKYPLPQYELGNDNIIDQARRELDQYFAGKLTTFKVKVDPQGTEFQRKAWAALQTIPYGETRSYAQQAKAIGSPKATRAIGAANGR
ncbi:MAG: methylated-DNA--[protein]-cysteine S-methyltransferase, partial [Hyphomonadaceae bacterium]|nr:methylated-DNA--[protein]-cysteine S-methyltransferase [Hyphomonadaceae bacterium]